MTAGVLMLCALLGLHTTRAQTGEHYFPETGHTVSGRFLEYWNANGGLAVFGYPLTDPLQEGGRSVQYFERQRFESHPENVRPYDVLLGRLGAERLNNGAPPPAGTPVAGCIYVNVTRHNICNQQGSAGFLSYYRSHGLEFDGRPGASAAESLALFGYPLSEAYDYTQNGQVIIAQWFERARFEWYPGNPVPYQVLLGRLGADVAPPTPPTPPPTATVSRVKIFLIAVQDNGSSGKLVGCGDSVVPVDVSIEPTPAPLQGALVRLLASKSQYFGESGLYNALYQSDLRVDRVVITDGRATVNLSGVVRAGGVCDVPRLKAQIDETVRQFSSVRSADIFINRVPLANVQ